MLVYAAKDSLSFKTLNDRVIGVSTPRVRRRSIERGDQARSRRDDGEWAVVRGRGSVQAVRVLFISR